MKSNFQDCLKRLLKDEGGYSNTPGDNGGPTNFGITIVDYRKYINKQGTANDVKNMSVASAGTIYKSKYWDALGCDALPSGVDYTCFDYGVNSGLGRPRKALQRFKSLSGTKLIDAINNERMTFLRGLAASQAHDQQFLKGWTSRVNRVHDYSLELAKKKDVTSGATIGTILAGIATWASTFWHNHEYLILGSGVAVAIIAGVVVHHYINKGKS